MSFFTLWILLGAFGVALEMLFILLKRAPDTILEPLRGLDSITQAICLLFAIAGTMLAGPIQLALLASNYPRWNKS